jgi:hypothetical protein
VCLSDFEFRSYREVMAYARAENKENFGSNSLYSSSHTILFICTAELLGLGFEVLESGTFMFW